MLTEIKKGLGLGLHVRVRGSEGVLGGILKFPKGILMTTEL